MTLKTEKFVRKPFYIDAVQVSDENISEVAEWCQGEIRTTAANNQDGIDEEYVKVRVHRPLNERQTKAFIGDWVLYAGAGFKVYTSKAFKNSFDLVGGPLLLDEDEVVFTPTSPERSQELFVTAMAPGDPGVALLKEIFEKPEPPVKKTAAKKTAAKKV